MPYVHIFICNDYENFWSVILCVVYTVQKRDIALYNGEINWMLKFRINQLISFQLSLDIPQISNVGLQYLFLVIYWIEFCCTYMVPIFVRRKIGIIWTFLLIVLHYIPTKSRTSEVNLRTSTVTQSKHSLRKEYSTQSTLT